jgi:ribonuclease HI
MTLYAATDGASRGNPGESGVGVIVRDETGREVLTLYGYLGTATNNIAEYSALVFLLQEMQKIPCSRLVVRSDSELLVRQINGEYKVRDPGLKKKFDEVQRLRAASPFALEVHYVPRAQNSEADRLANRGIDEKKFCINSHIQ